MIDLYTIAFAHVLVAAFIFMVAIAWAWSKKKSNEKDDSWESWDQ